MNSLKGDAVRGDVSNRHNSNSYHLNERLTVRDSGNDFWIPEIASDNGRFSFILFSFSHVISTRFFKECRFLELTFVSGAD